ncbi:ninja-family protein AFP3-like [Macadamia integrifolia]|uniref:ninja-family protein AFP3-like n=1 Tax=Macadamia integrifolia TaxID=60698 RepID=UPI001C4F5B78|nr:ninja-family protein AFP3-like [Macadamia integrifolia]
MDETTRGGRKEIENLSLQMNGYPIDLLKRFRSVSNRDTKIRAIGEDTEEIALNLGLSLGGCFGVDPNEKRHLIRSSSIAGLTNLVREDDSVNPPPIVTLPRTCSLPTETEEERRKRKELQCLKRMEAKRKRSEKQRNSRAGRNQASLEGSGKEEKQVEEELVMSINLKGKANGITAALAEEQLQLQHHQFGVKNGLSASVPAAAPPQFGIPSWATPCGIGVALPRGFDATANRNSSFLAAAALGGYPPSTTPQVSSLGSQGSSSSGISEFESTQVQGLNGCNEAGCLGSVQSLSEQVEQKTVMSPGATESTESKFGGVEKDRSKKSKIVRNGFEMGSNVTEEMPCVSTRGDGPNGKRIEGFLYKYRKGEEVRIVCVCHGRFLSPAEFVKHAGGGDVAHPLKHIVVNPSPTFS